MHEALDTHTLALFQEYDEGKYSPRLKLTRVGLWALHHGSWLGCNGSHNYQVTVSLHFVLFCFLFACIFVCGASLQVFSAETIFRSITFYAKIV